MYGEFSSKINAKPMNNTKFSKAMVYGENYPPPHKIEAKMNFGEQLKRQRVKHIVSSYQLAGTDIEAFDQYLTDLFHAYPAPLIELALVETLVDSWVRLSVIRGCEFLAIAHDQLQAWDDRLQTLAVNQPIASTVAPEQFRHITGLDPTPVFGLGPRPVVCPSL
jgi:hypothetical protein